MCACMYVYLIASCTHNIYTQTQIRTYYINAHTYIHTMVMNMPAASIYNTRVSTIHEVHASHPSIPPCIHPSLHPSIYPCVRTDRQTGDSQVARQTYIHTNIHTDVQLHRDMQLHIATIQLHTVATSYRSYIQ